MYTMYTYTNQNSYNQKESVFKFSQKERPYVLPGDTSFMNCNAIVIIGLLQYIGIDYPADITCCQLLLLGEIEQRPLW